MESLPIVGTDGGTEAIDTVYVDWYERLSRWVDVSLKNDNCNE